MTLPRRTYCYLCATELEQKSEYSWNCSSCEYTQYESPKPAAEIILRRDGKILIAERAQDPDKGTFDMPGGFIEANETAEQGVLREAEEELGIKPADIENLQYFTSFYTKYPYGREVYDVLVIVFVADLKAEVSTKSLDDVASTQWIGAADIQTVPWSREYHKKNATAVLTSPKD